MSRRRLVQLVVSALAALLLACGGDDDDSDAPADGGDIDLATADTELTITFPAGALVQGWHATVASGDFNGDGVLDLLVGLPFADGADGTRQDAGEAYVLFGPLSGDVDLTTPDAAGAIVVGAEVGDRLGGGVAAGDLNGDGIDDVILGAPASNGLVDIRTDMGEAYVIFGREDLSGTFDTVDQVQDVTIQPAEGFSTLGIAFAVGDMNGDGTDDLITGAPYAGREPNTPPGGPRTTVGEVYVFFGGDEFRGTLTVAEDDDDLRFSGEHQYDQFGADIALADLNGDGLPDLLVGASGLDAMNGDNPESGGAFAFYGSDSPTERRVASDADISIIGPTGYTLGTLVSVADLDANGEPEYGVSAPAAPNATAPESVGSGRFYRITPPPDSGQIDIEACDCVSVAYGAVPNGFFPATLAASPDGKWFALGAPGEAAGDLSGRGVIYLVRGGMETPDAVTSSRVLGAVAGEGLGSGITFADVNGDGTVELLALGVGAGETAVAKLYAITLTD